jgi:hypothetical protein
VSVERGERPALQLITLALIVVIFSGVWRLVQAGFGRLDLTGSMFFLFALASITVSIILAQRNAGYSIAFAAAAMLLSMLVFATCVLGWSIAGLTC